MKKKIPVQYAVVPRCYPGWTIVCIGGGPSLTRADVDAVRGRAVVIAVNDAYRLAPWAEVLYACDAKWWGWHKGAPGFTGMKYTIDKSAARWPGVQVLRNTGTSGLELRPDGLKTGRNSGYQAVNLAIHLGAARIVLLGYDMSRDAVTGKTHWFGDHPDRTPSPYRMMLAEFDRLPSYLATAGVRVANCSRRSMLRAFPVTVLEEELARPTEGVA